MLGNIHLGQYYAGDSVVHRLDPRCKIALLLVYMVLVFVAPGIEGQLVLAVCTVALMLATRIPVKTIVNSIAPLLFIIAIVIIVNLFFNHSGDVLVLWAFIKITTGSLYTSFFLSLRILLLLFSVSILTLTTSPIDLTDAAERMMRPLARFGFPAHEIAMMMSITLRFLPVFMDEIVKIKRAQEARGADFESGNLVSRMKVIIPLLVPLFASAFRHAEDLAFAMESRCYHGGEGRTRMHVLTIKRADYLAIALFVVCLTAFIVMRVYGG